MEDFIIAALVLVLFTVFLFKRQSFADALSPGSCTPTPVPEGRICILKPNNEPYTFTDKLTCQQTASTYPNAVSAGAGCGKHYCCQ
jgi:hypothetical protein